MQNSFTWLSAETVIEINKIVVAGGEHPEPHVLLDEMKLEGALQRPYTMWAYSGVEDVLDLGVSYMFAIAEAHAFIQGNKRTGFASGLNFLQNHGYDLVAPDKEETARLMIAVLERQRTQADFQTHLEQYIAPIE